MRVKAEHLIPSLVLTFMLNDMIHGEGQLYPSPRGRLNISNMFPSGACE